MAVIFPVDQMLAQLSEVMLCDRFRLRKRLLAFKQTTENDATTRAWQTLVYDIEKSAARLAQRRQPLTIDYPEELPISQKRDIIIEAIRHHQVTVIAGETGSGKTTQLPKICLALGRGVAGMIGHTQPRRLAARIVATRIAEELKSPLGNQVGYQVRFSDQVGEQTLVKLMTDGILLAEIPHDRFLEKYDTIIIDEAHERSLNIDFLLGYIKKILPKRPDLKVIITSATIDVERFSKHFNGVPIIEVSGRAYPVETWYRPAEHYFEQSNADDVVDEAFASFVLKAVQEIIDAERHGAIRGDILVFLSGERDIREVSHAIKKAQLRDTHVLPLYARLSAAEQNRVFAPHTGRRIVLATNVAETSLTVPGIRYVIDPGWARINRYSYRTKVQRLPIEAISQASANQRKGRCGRVSDGICIRLYSEADFLSRPAFTDPEISRTDLASVILRMLSLGLGDIEQFPFVDMPDSRYISDGFKTLQELQAVNHKNELTSIGRQLAQLPIDVRLGRILIEAHKNRSLSELLIIVSGLSVQDPRERPAEHQQQADEKHRQYWDIASDFIAYINLWSFYEEARQRLTQNQLRSFCHQHFLSYLRLREWRDLHTQLRLACQSLGFAENTHAADYASIHRALLSGLLANIGYKSEENDYIGTRNRKFHIFPGSSLFKKQPKWVLSAELVETQRVYARCVASIDPEWVEPLAKHIVKRHYFEPHWEKHRAQVVAFEQVILYGLIITAKRKVNYGPIDPTVSCDIFIRDALVEGQLASKAPFFIHNRQLLDDVDELEAKARKRDIVVDRNTLFDFYHERIPEHIYNEALLIRWLNTQPDATLLFLTRDTLLKRDTSEITGQEYPDVIEYHGMRFALRYHFQPGDEDDGVTVVVPVIALNQLPVAQLEWLVPGMLRAKCEALLRSLPKQLRKNFVPVPNFVDALMEVLTPGDVSLTQMIAQQLRRMTGVKIPDDAWQFEQMDAHHFMNVSVVDENGAPLAMGRDLITLQERFKNQASELSACIPHQQAATMTTWSIEVLPQTQTHHQAGLTMTLFPALVDEGKAVSVQLFDNQETAQHALRHGVARLVYLTLLPIFKDGQRLIHKINETQLLYGRVGDAVSFYEELLLATILALVDEHASLPRTQAQFNELCNIVKSRWVEMVHNITEILLASLTSHQKISKTISGRINPAWMFTFADIKEQLQQLFKKSFLTTTPFAWLRHYPRYLQAILIRLDKFSGQLAKDRQLTLEINEFWKLHTQQAPTKESLLYRWMIEEYRVSVFAQALGTHVSVSPKKLREQYAKK